MCASLKTVSIELENRSCETTASCCEDYMGNEGESRLSWKWIIVTAIVAFLVGVDPLRLSIVANNPAFEPKYGTLPPLENKTSDPRNRLQQAEIIRVQEFTGPESIAFDLQGKGPYTGVADGRIMMWNGPDIGWTVFAYTSKNWSGACIPRDPTSANLKHEHICGRPLGIRFDKNTGKLYIADAYFGLMVVGKDGGLAASLSTQAEGLAFKFTNDLDLDPERGLVYFTDTSSKYSRREFVLTAFEWDASGRLLQYDIKTRETKVLLRNLNNPNGVCIDQNRSSLIIAEGTSTRLLRYWLTGTKAGTVDLFAIAPGHPDNIRMNFAGEFWVAMHCRRTILMEIMTARPWMRKILARLPISLKYIYSLMLSGKPHAMVGRYSADGDLLEVLEDNEGKVVKLVSEVEEKGGKLWMGSAIVSQIALLDISSSSSSSSSSIFG